MWTYDGLPGTGSTAARRDAMRLHLRDTSSGRQLLQDEELKYFLDQNGSNIWRAAADACEVLASREAQAKSVGDLSLSGMGINWRDQAKAFRLRANRTALPYAGGLTVTDKETREQDTDRATPFAVRTLHQHPDVADTQPSAST